MPRARSSAAVTSGSRAASQELEREIAEVEAQLAPIAARFADNGYYSRVTLDEIRADEGRQRDLQTQLDAAMRGWETAAHELEALAGPA